VTIRDSRAFNRPGADPNLASVYSPGVRSRWVELAITACIAVLVAAGIIILWGRDLATLFAL